MNDTDLERFRRAVDLAQLDRKDEAHGLLNILRQSNPANTNVLLWSAYTATDLSEAKIAIQQAAAHDPTNPEILRASRWLDQQQKQRLGRRFRGDISRTFVPQLPAELKNFQPKSVSSFAPAPTPAPAPVAVRAPALVPVATNPPVKLGPQTTTPAVEVIPAEKTKPKLPESPVKFPKVAKVKKSNVKINWGKIFVRLVTGVIVLAAMIGGLLLVQPVREFVFNTGPLTQTEQNFVNEAMTINDLTTSRINLVYNCIINVNPKVCMVEEGYKQAYVGLGEVSARFQALKNPSNRFDGPYNTLLRAYSNLATTSKFAFDSINQHQMVANQVETSTRLDEGRKLLEQGKAELKNTAQQYGPRK